MNTAETLVLLLTVYAALGVVFALPFLALGVQRLDPAARSASLGFRLLIAPGCVALWPLLALRWIRRAPPPVERNAHRQSARPREDSA